MVDVSMAKAAMDQPSTHRALVDTCVTLTVSVPRTALLDSVGNPLEQVV